MSVKRFNFSQFLRNITSSCGTIDKTVEYQQWKLKKIGGENTVFEKS